MVQKKLAAHVVSLSFPLVPNSPVTSTSYLEVLTNETNYFAAELGLAQAQLNELLGLVSVYRNLGGGWQQ